MPADEFWLSAFYSHQGQEAPDQPDNSWDVPDYGVGGFDLGGWGDLIPAGAVVPVTYGTGGAETITAPLGLLDWSTAFHSEHTTYWKKIDGVWREFAGRAAKFSASEGDRWPGGSTKFTADVLYPDTPDYVGTKKIVDAVSDPVWPYRYGLSSGGIGDPYAYYIAYPWGSTVSGVDPVSPDPPDNGWRLSSGYRYTFQSNVFNKGTYNYFFVSVFDPMEPVVTIPAGPGTPFNPVSTLPGGSLISVDVTESNIYAFFSLRLAEESAFNDDWWLDCQVRVTRVPL